MQRAAGSILLQHRHVKAALSPSLHQVHLHNKFLGLMSNRSAMTKPFFCSPDWSSSPPPAGSIHLLWDDGTSPCGHPKQQPLLQQGKSTKPLSLKRPPTCPGAGAQPGEDLPSPQNPGTTCHHSQHGPCPSEKDMLGRWQ